MLIPALLLAANAGCDRADANTLAPVQLQVRVGSTFAFDPGVIHCRPGQTVRIQISNTVAADGASLPHTMAVLKLGTDVDQFASAALQASEQEQFVPAQYRDQVIATSPVIQSGETTEILFTAPLQKGDYPVVCSFPGHCMLGMRGILSVQ